MPFAIGGNQLDTGYEVSNSLRFNDDDSPRLTREFAQEPTGNRKTFTISFWVKRSSLSSNHAVVSASTTSNFNDKLVGFRGDTNGIEVNNVASGSDAIQIITNRKFRDISAWYHIVVAIDTTQSSLADGVKLYVNGERDTSFDGSPVYNQNATFEIGRNGSTTAIGMMQVNSTQFFDGYLAEMHFIDGVQKDQTDFGEFNDNGVWIPKKYDGTYGNNGFYLEFKQTGTSQNSSGIGADTSGQDQHFAVTNLAAIDVTTDTCTNNFATLNPLDNIQSATFSEGNCKVVTNTSNRNFVTGTFGLTSGKWYWECKLTAVTSNANDQAFFGIADLDDRGVNSTGESLGDRANEVGWHQEQGRFQRNNSFSNGSTAGDSAGWVIGDIVAIALDADNNRVTIAKNGQWADGSGNADESNPTSFVSYNSSTMTPAMGEGGGGTSATWECNFGNSAFSISSGNSDSEGHGNFEFAVPSGYFELCTKDLAESG